VGDGDDRIEPDGARVPAEGPVGLAVQRKAEFRFCDGEYLHQAAVDAWADAAARLGAATVGDHHHHQRPETPREPHRSRQVAQEPQEDMSMLHAADYAAAFFLADVAPVFPLDSGRKWLIGLEFAAEFPLC